MKSLRNDIEVVDIRGNVPTRIQKLRDGHYDAILIAYAGVARLKIDLSEFHCEKLDPHEFIPAPAQGVLAIQIRESDKDLFATRVGFDHFQSYQSQKNFSRPYVISFYEYGEGLWMFAGVWRVDGEPIETSKFFQYKFSFVDSSGCFLFTPGKAIGS